MLLSTACAEYAAGSEDVAVGTGNLHTTALLTTASPTVCWVKDDASTTSDVDFDAATAYVQNVLAQWEAASGLDFVWQGRCGAPSGGIYPGTIRILWNEMNRGAGYQIPGCSATHPNANWGGFPGTYSTHCRWNAALATGQPINNYLHEVGHTIGMLHEMERSDNNIPDCSAGYTPDDQHLLTPYDVMSVMHYTLSSPTNSCPAPGNWGNTGLSEWDKLGVEIAYPRSTTVPLELHGMLTGPAGSVIQVIRADTVIQTSWLARGALPGVFANTQWTITPFLGSPQVVSSNPSFTWNTVGQIAAVDVSFTDPFGRSRSGSAFMYASTELHTAILMSVL
ncbi:MAG: hypothetical protein ABUL60_16900 [Myxococcales bacterium]